MIPGCCLALYLWRPLFGKTLPDRPGIWSAIYSIDETKRAQPRKCKGQCVAGCLFRGAAELKFCLTPKGTAAKSIWQHVAENPRVAASASFPACREATFKFHICRIFRGCPGRLRRWSPSGLRWRKQSQAWQLYLLSRTCELQSRWASVHRRPPGNHNPPAHGSHVAFEGGRAGNQMKRQQQCKTTMHPVCHCLPGLGVRPARLLVWMFQSHLDQSRAVYRLGPRAFLGPSWSGCSPGCYCRPVATTKTIGSNVPAMQRTAHSSGRHLKSLQRTSSGQQSTPLRMPVLLTCCLPNLARSEGAKLVSHALQVLSLPAYRQDVMKQAWTAQVTDSCAFVSRFVLSGR